LNVLSTEHKQFFADNIYAIDSDSSSTGGGIIEVYNTTLGGAVLTWSPALNTFITGALGVAAVIGMIVKIMLLNQAGMTSSIITTTTVALTTGMISRKFSNRV
jgi:hypothetical protein